MYNLKSSVKNFTLPKSFKEGNMNLTLKRLEDYTLEDFELLAKWDNDREIIYFNTVNRQEKEVENVSAETLLEAALKNKSKYIYFVMKDLEPIGAVSIIDNFPYLESQDEKVAWISILIGEKKYWGQGFGQEAMRLLEDQCRKMNYKKIELGVFRFNERAYKMYKKLGYEEFKVNSNFTYYDGKWHDDIRMIKTI